MSKKITISEVVNELQFKRVPLEKVCKVKTYLPIREKMELCKEFSKVMEENFDNQPQVLKGMYDFICFHILLVKYYTNIDVTIDLDVFDELMKNDIISGVIVSARADYGFLKTMLQIQIESGD